MDWVERLSLAVAVGSLAAVTIEIILREAAIFRELPRGAEEFARRAAPPGQRTRLRPRAAPLAGGLAALVLTLALVQLP
jgi:hypothetical protein